MRIALRPTLTPNDMAFATEAMPGGLGESHADSERVVLVNELDEPVGIIDKLAAHQGAGFLHRAFSVFLFDRSGRMLIQRRAPGKYHFAGLWTNACCSHPRPGEPVADAARRRLREELGMSADLTRLFGMVYTARDPASGLVEREYDHVFVGRAEGEPRPARDEVSAIDRRSPVELLRACASEPERFTPWFRLALCQLEQRGHLAEWSRSVRTLNRDGLEHASLER